MADLNLSLTQKLSQHQVMKLSQNQIMAMGLIGMGNFELREEIYKKVEENPALEIERDPFSEGTGSLRKGNESSAAAGNVTGTAGSGIHSGKAGKSGTEASEVYQQMLESNPDESETLQEHLLHQLNMTQLEDVQYNLCRKLIENLDNNGFHILAPVSLIDKNAGETEQMLEPCMKIIRGFEPSGICCANITESLEIQAGNRENPPKLALFILHGNLEMLKPPAPEKVQKKILDYIEEQKKMAFRDTDEYEISENDASLEDIEKAIQFIQSLDPIPARNFGGDDTHFVRPDVYVVPDSDGGFRVNFANDTLPVISVSEELKEIPELKEQVKSARSFMDMLEFRRQVLMQAFRLLVVQQADFFAKGPGHLQPLTQKKFAEALAVSESTVSRIGDSKYIRCSWGTFPVKYFFTKGVAVSDSEEISTDTVKIEIEKILDAQKPGEKRLSDQKIADMLEAKGIKIARRTVSKYRAAMNIESSYNR